MTRAGALVSALALAFGAAMSAAPTGKVIGHGARLKTTRIYLAQGTAVAPKTISASITPMPAQPVKVQWSVACQKPNKADPAIQIGATGASGQTTVRGTATVRLKLPFMKPPACVATVYATLAGKGALVLRLVQT
jgi:hypothetical protein